MKFIRKNRQAIQVNENYVKNQPPSSKKKQQQQQHIIHYFTKQESGLNTLLKAPFVIMFESCILRVRK